VRADVIDITPLRTKLLETGVSEPPPAGQPVSTDYWVHGRQPTGRLVAVSNKATFESPVFNYSSMWEFVWQEVTFPISYNDDWHETERIIDDEAREISATDEAHHAMEEMQRRYPVPHSELEPRVYVRATDNCGAVGALRRAGAHVPDRGKRPPRASGRAGIPIASPTMDVTVISDDDRTSRESSRTG
jgi:hypothetical protein